MGPPPSNEPPKYVIMRAVGGEVGSASSLAPKIGPLGLSPKQVGEDIKKACRVCKAKQANTGVEGEPNTLCQQDMVSGKAWARY